MTKTQRTVLAAVAVLAIAILSRNEGATRLLQGAFGQLASLALPAQTAQVEAARGSTDAGAGAQAPASQAGGSPALLSAAVSVAPNDIAERGYVVEARVTTKDAKPAKDVAVSFYEAVDLLGSREMLIGTATTDGWGRAAVPYLPPEDGRHEIVSRTKATSTLPATEGRTTFEATVVAPPAYSREVLPLATFSAPLPYVGLVVLLAVWGLFAVALLGTARRIATAAPPATHTIRASRGVALGARTARQREE